jgi:hypothetical protein
VPAAAEATMLDEIPEITGAVLPKSVSVIPACPIELDILQ